MKRKGEENGAQPSDASTRYRAPALAKGLQILELLAPQNEPLTLSRIAERLGRSTSEIFRMIQELEGTNYIRRSAHGEGYEVTNKLFLLGLEQPLTRTLLEVALPIMRQFSEQTHQSCHLAIPVDDLIVVVARAEAPGPVSFSVRQGHRQKISRSTSGIVLFAWQTESVQSSWLTRLSETDPDFDEVGFLQIVQRCKRRGYMKKDSAFVRGVIDIAAPVLCDGQAIASFTVPCLIRLDHDPNADIPVTALIEVTKRISEELPPGL